LFFTPVPQAASVNGPLYCRLIEKSWRITREIKMVWRFQGVGVLCAIGSVLACSSLNPNLRATRMPDGSIEVKGPLAGPFPTLEALAMNACEIMTSQPGASNGIYGFEYCALNYS
jgi:hypothetical protein